MHTYIFPLCTFAIYTCNADVTFSFFFLFFFPNIYLFHAWTHNIIFFWVTDKSVLLQLFILLYARDITDKLYIVCC